MTEWFICSSIRSLVSQRVEHGARGRGQKELKLVSRAQAMESLAGFAKECGLNPKGYGDTWKGLGGFSSTLQYGL